MFKTHFDEENKLWKGCDIPSLYNPEISIAQVLLNSMVINGNKIAQISDDSKTRMTFDELRIKTICAAQNLRKRGHESNGVHSFIAKNTDHLAPILFASFCVGCPVNALESSFSKDVLTYMFKTTKPVLVFCDVEIYEIVKICLNELKNDAKIFTFGGSKGDSEAVEVLFSEIEDEQSFVPTRVDGINDIALISCSSGTTAMSKGISLSHAALINTIADYLVIDSNDVILAFSTIYWLSAWFCLLTGTFRGATRIITKQTFCPELEFRVIEEYRITFLFNTPYQVSLLLKSDLIDKIDLSNVKNHVLGGAKLQLEAKIKMNSYLPNGRVCIGYGMTEIAGYVTCDFSENPSKDTVGKIVRGSCIKIVDDNGNRCDVNVDGMICIKTNFKFHGYYGDSKLTNELFDDEGFVKSGDIGHFDDDGDLIFVARRKEMIRYNDTNITPTDIEAFLEKCSDIELVCVVGIPNETCTDLPAALILRKKHSKLTEKDVFDMIAENFVDDMKLRGGVYFVDEIPMTPSGKIQRFSARNIALELSKKKLSAQ